MEGVDELSPSEVNRRQRGVSAEAQEFLSCGMLSLSEFTMQSTARSQARSDCNIAFGIQLVGLNLSAGFP
ncbi:hypothetical protein CVIRNUC_006258 [Coccomyxa viridis]|uniref:Uncharacterized protein n=1 Tax=Coccomyxa viridis TaxID=1274662 RepID=A0AAV1I6T0_9CHLO|nr:hypothetical protein CVIRNUC_006258 [Coccomyxa viridis]